MICIPISIPIFIVQHHSSNLYFLALGVVLCYHIYTPSTTPWLKNLALKKTTPLLQNKQRNTIPLWILIQHPAKHREEMYFIFIYLSIPARTVQGPHSLVKIPVIRWISWTRWTETRRYLKKHINWMWLNPSYIIIEI